MRFEELNGVVVETVGTSQRAVTRLQNSWVTALLISML